MTFFVEWIPYTMVLLDKYLVWKFQPAVIFVFAFVFAYLFSHTEWKNADSQELMR